MVHSFPHLACWSGCRPLPLVSTVLADYFSAVMRVISSCQEFGPGLVWAFMQIPAKRMKYDKKKKNSLRNRLSLKDQKKKKKKHLLLSDRKSQTANLLRKPNHVIFDCRNRQANSRTPLSSSQRNKRKQAPLKRHLCEL